MAAPHLRPERGEDRELVRGLHSAAFGERGGVVAHLVDDLHSSISADGGLSLVADEAGDVVGHVMFTHSWLDAPDRLLDVQVLSPLAVHPLRQRRGIGSALVRAGLRVMVDRAVPVVFLEGHPAYYRRFGFRSGADLGFRKPSLRIPDAAFQAIALSSRRPSSTGSLVYAETFWRHDAVGLRPPAG